MKTILYERCLRCGRKLKKDENKKIGYGQICLQKQLSNTQSLLFSVDKENTNATK